MAATVPPRRARGHAASGARMFVGGVAFSATLALAGFMAAGQASSSAAAGTSVNTVPAAIGAKPGPSTSAGAAPPPKVAKPLAESAKVAAGAAPGGGTSLPALTSAPAQAAPATIPQTTNAPVPVAVPNVAPTAAPSTAPPPPPPPVTVPPTTPLTAPPTTATHAS